MTTTWTAEIDLQLGTVPDTVVAELIGVTPSTVKARRDKLGIKPASKHHAKRVKPECLDLSGQQIRGWLVVTKAYGNL